MQCLSLALFCVALTACNVNNEANTKVDSSDTVKVNAIDTAKNDIDDTVKVSSSVNDIIKASGNEISDCHSTIPDWQIEELAQVPCLTLPISNQDFLDIKKFNNGIFNIQGDNKYLKSKAYDEQINIGLLPYDSKQVFLISFNNSITEDGYPAQYFYIKRIKKDEPKNSIFNLSASPLGIVNYKFQDSELIKLGIDPNEFSDIDFNILGEENIHLDDTCMMNFNIDIDWRLTRSYTCQNSQANQEIIDSFKEQFGFNYKLINIDGEADYKRVD